ncbi:MAG: glutamine-hydrolyzing carbamoyl-phosphate synthase small subunit, partial [Bdellovibrionales bacterium]|nr:glutamine-hydrolyzing carbamoyl-phosphate synthase small subunit [Bdellovibrionales bacterium]
MKAGTVRETATLALADGTVFRGVSVGAQGETSGEVVFNTSMYGYQEILTDPSYAFQMLTFTYPHIGNVGVNPEDVESPRVQVAGLITRSFCEHYSNYRATGSLEEYLIDNDVVGISDIDTRSLVQHLRSSGAQMGVIASGKQDAATLVDKARALPSMEGLDLVLQVTTKEPYEWRQGTWRPGVGYPEFSEEELSGRPLVVAIDFGIKFNILRLLIDAGFRVTVVPAQTPASAIAAMAPAGVFLSNGPGDPAAVTYGIETVRELIGKKPMFGICLGHQILGHALGAPTFKLKFGHRGGNHPVRNEKTGSVEITVQNHGFATDLAAIPKHVTVTHMNLNDRTCEGLEVVDAGCFSVQYHPESSPGPQDARYLFQEFKG